MACGGKVNLNHIFDREHAEALGEPTHFPCPHQASIAASSSQLTDIRCRMARLKDLLIAADQLGGEFQDSLSGPLFAVMKAALVEARALGGLFDDLCEAFEVPA